MRACRVTAMAIFKKPTPQFVQYNKQIAALLYFQVVSVSGSVPFQDHHRLASAFWQRQSIKRFLPLNQIGAVHGVHRHTAGTPVCQPAQRGPCSRTTKRVAVSVSCTVSRAAKPTYFCTMPSSAAWRPVGSTGYQPQPPASTVPSNRAPGSSRTALRANQS